MSGGLSAGFRASGLGSRSLVQTRFIYTWKTWLYCNSKIAKDTFRAQGSGLKVQCNWIG